MDIEAMKKTQDVRGLIRSLDHRNTDIQWRAADALGTLGEMACGPLLRVLAYPRVNVRLGAIEALGKNKCPRLIEPLIRTLESDECHEVRWVAALALGEIGDNQAIPPLLRSLHDEDRYVRYGSVKSLYLLQWQPENDTDRAYALIALQEWESIKKLGLAAVGPLIEILKDKNPATRAKIVELLGGIGGPDAKKACEKYLKDVDPEVRWQAVISAKKCGVSTNRITFIHHTHHRTTPSPAGAAILNLFFFGLGYQYIGKWWGALVFMCYMTIMVLIQLYSGFIFPFIFVYPITAVFAIQTYYMVKRMPDT